MKNNKLLIILSTILIVFICVIVFLLINKICGIMIKLSEESNPHKQTVLRESGSFVYVDSHHCRLFHR